MMGDEGVFRLTEIVSILSVGTIDPVATIPACELGPLDVEAAMGFSCDAIHRPHSHYPKD